MAARARVQVEGARRLRATLRKAGRDLGDLKEAHAAAGRIVQAAAAAAVPRRSGELAGTLRSSGTATQAVVRAGFARTPYAGPIHWGWPARGITAQPFIAEPAQQTEPRWILGYHRAVDQILANIKGA